MFLPISSLTRRDADMGNVSAASSYSLFPCTVLLPCLPLNLLGFPCKTCMEGEGATSHATFRDTSQLPVEPATAGVCQPLRNLPLPKGEHKAKPASLHLPGHTGRKGGGEATCRRGSAEKKSLVNPSAGEVAAPPPPALAVSVRSGALHSSGTLPVCLAHLLN